MSITIKNKIRKNKKINMQQTARSSSSVNSQSNYSLAYIWTVFFIGVGLGCIHMYHVSTMFENDTHFSHLSNLEREMCFRSEMGLYYSYYKRIVEAPTFAAGYYSIVHDNLTEYPNTIDTLERFNLYPEVVIALLYRNFLYYTTSWLGLVTRECWTIERGSGYDSNSNSLPPVTSCEGPGDPMYFYLDCIWLLAGLTMFLLYMFGVYLSGNLLGGLLSSLSYWYNQSEATRVQWAPPLRENMSYPALVLQMLCITFVLRKTAPNGQGLNKIVQITLISLTTWICLLLWQFSQFFLATQLIAVYLICQVNIITKKTFLNIVSGHLIAIFLSCLCMHGNKMLLSSLHLSLATSIAINSFFWKDLSELSMENSLYFITIRLLHDTALILCLTIFIKSENPINFLFHKNNNDDGHILNLLRSKFTNYKDFHTLMYSCAPEFDFLPVETVGNLFLTLLIPSVIFVIMLVVYNWFRADFKPLYSELVLCDENVNRLKAYAVEDYFEKNSVTMKQMRAGDMKQKIGQVLENLEKCDYDMKQMERDSSTSDMKYKSKDAKNEFLKNIAELKLEISKNTSSNNRNNEVGSDANTVGSCKSDLENHMKRLNTKDATNNKKKSRMDLIREYKIDSKTEPEVLYNILQLCAFVIMAGLVMRLKLFLTPQLCVILSLVTAKRYFQTIMSKKLWPHLCLVALLTLAMSFKGISNIKEQRAILGEYSNAPLEQLLLWISSDTAPDAVFGGPMAVTAAVLLATRRPIVNHPHYENARVRDVTKSVYSVYSRRSLLDAYNLLSRLQVQYLIVDYAWCYTDNISGCRIYDLFDVEEPELKSRPILCRQLSSSKDWKNSKEDSDDAKLFERVFENSAYIIFKLKPNQKQKPSKSDIQINVDLNPATMRREYRI